MPRSKDPRNYGPFYHKLYALMDRREYDIRLTMTGRMAIYHRNNFYAFVNAWKHEAQRLTKDKTVLGDREHLVEAALHAEDILRDYMVFIEPDPKAHMDTQVELRFVKRSLDDRVSDHVAQLDALLAANTNPDYWETKEQFTRASAGFKAVDGRKIIDGWKEMIGDERQVHLEDMDHNLSDEEAEAILNPQYPDPTDMTDLITPDNPPSSPEVPQHFDPMQEALRASENLRELERKRSKESENSS